MYVFIDICIYPLQKAIYYELQLPYFTNQNSDSSICKLNMMGPYLNFNLNNCFCL